MTNDNTKGSREALLQALHNVIAHTPGKERNILSEALEQYAYRYNRSYRDMTKGTGLITSLLDTLEEAADARICRDANGLPEEP